MTSELAGKRLFLDANVIIYLLENVTAYEKQVDALRELFASGNIKLLTSELSLCEVLVGPFKKGNDGAAESYRQFLEISGVITLVPTRRSTYIRAGYYRAKLGLKTPDAIHFASAVESGADIFLTNDSKFKPVTGLQIVQFSSLS